ncbi:hypothetical protein APSETT445_004007 [Aspergillus pseudonomiae]
MTADEESPCLQSTTIPRSPESDLELRRKSERANKLVIYGSFIDLMPPNEVALFRGYANVVNVAGRSLGAPLSSNMVPYFIRVGKATDILASLTYVVTAVGVSIGGLIAGAIIKR